VPAGSLKIIGRNAFRAAGLLLLLGPKLIAQSALPPATSSTHEVTDQAGRLVHVPTNPQRIISLAPSVTETVYALGDEAHLVGDTDYCDYPPEAKKIPKVGGVIDPNLEQIAALRPDLVLMARSANHLETVRALESLGIPSYATDAHTVDEIISSTERLADILNVPAAGKALGDDSRRRLAELQGELKGAAPRRVLFIVWMDPLISVSQKTFIADAIRHAGAVSIVESSQEWPQISLEEVLRLQPEYLVFANSHTGEGAHDFDALATRPGWRNLEAVRQRHYAVVSDAVNRPSPRIVSVIENLARQLHPEIFKTAPEEQKTPVAVPEVHTTSPKPASSLLPQTTAGLESSCAR